MRKQLSIWERRIPTFFALIILLVGVGITTVVLRTTGLTLFGNANATQEPKDVRISNVTDSSLTISYTTIGSVYGSVTYGKENSMGSLGLDEQDQKQGSPTNHTIHYITLRHLSPSTTYYFSILSGGTVYLHDNTPFTVKTGTKITDSPPKLTPLAGKITAMDNSSPDEALLYATSNNAQVLSTLVKQGNYILPLVGIRNTKLTNYITPDPTANFSLFVTDGNDNATAKITQTADNVPPIALSQNYDFTVKAAAIGAFVASSSAAFPSFTASTPTTETAQDVTIITPTANQQFIDMQPVFKGTAAPLSPVTITLHSDPITITVNTDSHGIWSYRPDTPLTQGDHTISITAKDSFGIQSTIAQTFTIFPSGSQVAQSATPSATLTPSATPTGTPIPTATPTIAVTPTDSPTPTPTPAEPTATPTPLQLGPTGGITPMITQGGGPTPPISGSSTVLVAGIMGTFLMLVGILLFLLTRGII